MISNWWSWALNSGLFDSRVRVSTLMSTTKERGESLKFLILAIQLLLNKSNLFLLSRGQMISAEDCEFIQRFEMKRTPEEKQEMLQNEGSQVIDVNVIS